MFFTVSGGESDFEPLVPSTLRVPNTNFYRATEHAGDYAAYGRWAADRIEQAIEFEGADTVAACSWSRCRPTAGTRCRARWRWRTWT